MSSSIRLSTTVHVK